ncbi:MAG: C2H2-type zinc finger protein [Halobacteriota archaeon]
MTDSDGDRSEEWPPETTVPDREDPFVCPYCSFPLPDDEQLRLHVGLRHYHVSSAAEREAFRTAYATEQQRLNRFRIVALGGLVALYFGFLIIYAILVG